MTATCPADSELERLLANEMSAQEEATLETHVAGCAGCQRRLDLLSDSALLARAWPGHVFRNGDGTPDPAGDSEPVGDIFPTLLKRLEHQGLPGGHVDNRRATTPTGRPRFTVLSQHAEGGLGRVHLARDEQLRRTVALKEIRPERADDPDVRLRFLNEAEITGQLEHPGIVPIYALEYDAAGRPVYAMRFIQGRTLKDAIRAHHERPTPMGIRGLLQRFVSVCQTVAYAHSKQVIHRDLKPENVMLGDFGETLVVDWGLAKSLVDSDASFVVDSGHEPAPATDHANSLVQSVHVWPGQTLVATAGQGDQLTVAGQVMGTPAYMAPEQARGEQLTPAADIYALGAVLFKLLAGKPPYHGNSSYDVIKQVIAGPPSEPGGVSRAPLTAVCRKAMAREPQARYASAADLARDVERWLADEPVGAYREPWPARAGRWIRRHRTLAASLGVATGLLLVVAVGVGLWQERLAEQRRIEDDHDRLQIEALLDRCETAVNDDDAAGARFAVGDAERHAETLESGRPTARLARCRLAADLLADLDRIDDLRWDVEGGRLQGPERTVREWPGAFLRLGVVVGQTPAPEAAATVNGSLVRERLLAALDLWLVYAPPQDRAALAELLEAADPDSYRDAVRSAVRREDWASVKALAAREEALSQPARFAAALGSIDNVALDRRLVVLARAAQARPRAFAALMTAGSLYTINDAATAADRIAWYRSAVTARPDRCIGHHWLGIALRDKGDLDGAVAALRTAIALEPNYAMAHNNLGVALVAKKDLDGGIAEYHISLALDPKSVLTHNNLGVALQFKNNLAEAIKEYRTAIALNPKFAPPHNNLGYALQVRDDPDGALTEYRTAAALDAKHMLCRYNLGNLLKEKGDLDGAVAAFKEANKINPNEKAVSQRLAEVERWRKLLPRLDRVAAGTAEPANAAEAVEFFNLCRQPFQKRYAAAARLYAKASAADPTYANDSARLYDAARCAALAGCGLGADGPPDAAARADLRKQALGWLVTTRKSLERRLASGNANDRKAVADRLSAWLAEKDLAGVRPGASRAGWSSSEAAAWDAYWSGVQALFAKANYAAPAGK